MEIHRVREKFAKRRMRQRRPIPLGLAVLVSLVLAGCEETTPKTETTTIEGLWKVVSVTTWNEGPTEGVFVLDTTLDPPKDPPWTIEFTGGRVTQWFPPGMKGLWGPNGPEVPAGGLTYKGTYSQIPEAQVVIVEFLVLAVLDREIPASRPNKSFVWGYRMQDADHLLLRSAQGRWEFDEYDPDGQPILNIYPAAVTLTHLQRMS